MKKRHQQGVASAISLCFRHAPLAAGGKLLIEVIGGAIMPVMVLVVASFMDHALAFAQGNGRMAALAASLALMAACYGYAQIAPVATRLADRALENALRENVRPQLIQKQARTAFALLERADTQDLIGRVCGGAEGRLMAILDGGIGLVRLLIQVIGILSLLAAHIWWALPLFLISSIPIAIIAYRGGQAIDRSDVVTTKLTRAHYYLSGLLSGREAAAERALFGYADEINRKFSATHLLRSNLVTKEIAIEEVAINACGLILNVLVIAAAFALLGPARDGAVSHGLYVSLVGALIALARIITGSVSKLISGAAGHIAYMRDYTRFFALPESESGAEQDAQDEPVPFRRLEIRNLRFRYTEGSPYVLDGVNLVMEAGKSHSLIGHNGAGKSTLTKILLGLYREFEGEILINGADIGQYSQAQLRGLFAIVYQDYARYELSLRDNVTLGGDGGRFASAVALADLESIIAKLPQGADTRLGRIYEDGADLSGGEWQRIAIARALNAGAPFLILDEPTASLSPMMESKLYRRFAEIAQGKTSLLISHRLGSTKLSDVLFVLDRGVIMEAGTHGELMALGGAYAEQFTSQRSWYDERE